MKRSKLLVLFTVLMVLVMATPVLARVPSEGEGPVAVPGKVSANGNYIVMMADEPAVTYTGGLAGYRATAVNNAKIDPTNKDVVKYIAYLNGRHSAAANAVGATKFYDYNYTFNGFAAKLTPAQAEQLRKQPGVVYVIPDETVYADTITTGDFLGLSAPGGLWSHFGGPQNAGDNIVIGIIDSGIWPENPSFAWQDDLGIRPHARWFGICEEGEDFTADLCNGKILGARYFNEGWGGDAGIEAQRPWEFNSPRDYNGHGSHTASTAGGNEGTPVVIDGTLLGYASGMAPGARIAVYKALWSTVDGSTASGNYTDLVAAIDATVADGVDVINYSISGSTSLFYDPAEQAFMRAARAGIFVAASAGNSGPTASTVAHNSPWLTTVAAGTHDRFFAGDITLGNSAVYTGASIGAGTGVLPLIKSVDAGLAGADATMVRLCYAAVDNGGVAVLDPAKVAGKIVQCDRGVTNRVNKSLAVAEAGGLGMILTNTSPSTLNADIHAVPSVHTDEIAGAAIKAYIDSAGAGATAQLSAFYTTGGVVSPNVASFSSRGPAIAGAGDLLKPDIMAPGVDVLAAVSPMTAGGEMFAAYQGTSMSSPHIAGLAALIKQIHPAWSPMAIKSAFMTTATQLMNNGSPIPSTPFGYGAGQVVPNSAADPGLVYDSSWRDWFGFMCGAGQPYLDMGVGAYISISPFCPMFQMDPSDLNYPTIAINALAGSQTVTRSVTNVSLSTETYTASYEGTGFDVVVEPAEFTIAPGETVSYEVTFTRTDAPLNAYAFGKLIWNGDLGHSVASITAVKPVALAAPIQVSGTGDDISYDVTFGYDGPFTATARGLVPAVTFDGTVAEGGSVSFNVIVPAGTTYARFQLFNEYVENPGDDLDMRVYRGATLVGSSGAGDSNEVVNLLNPTAATYTIYVDGYDTVGPDSDFTLFTWVLGTADEGNMTVTAPASATTATTGTITLSFSGLAAGTRYLGSVAYDGTTGMPNPTIVRVDTAGVALAPAPAFPPADGFYKLFLPMAGR